MVKFECILCPLDFSEFSARAYDYAQSLAARYKSKLYLQHIIEPAFSAYPGVEFPDSIGQVYREIRLHAEDALKEFVKKHTREGLHPQWGVEDGHIPTMILGFAEKKQVDLIVMGTHGRRGLDHLLLGSVTEKVLRKSRCPVLVVGRPANDRTGTAEPLQLRKIFYCTDFSKNSEQALGYALSLAEEFGAELTLLHVVEDFPLSKDLPTLTAEIVSQLEAMVPSDVRGKGKIRPRLRVGKPHEEIIREAVENAADLIIVAVRGRHLLDFALFGSTTHRVIQRGPCPVLAVHI
jgi:nucleotide-binding universal stress UspA family protein